MSRAASVTIRRSSASLCALLVASTTRRTTSVTRAPVCRLLFGGPRGSPTLGWHSARGGGSRGSFPLPGARSRAEGLPLQLGQPGAAGGPQVQQQVQLATVEGHALGGALDLDEPAVAAHHDVHVRARRGVPDV